MAWWRRGDRHPGSDRPAAGSRSAWLAPGKAGGSTWSGATCDGGHMAALEVLRALYGDQVLPGGSICHPQVARFSSRFDADAP